MREWTTIIDAFRTEPQTGREGGSQCDSVLSWLSLSLGKGSADAGKGGSHVFPSLPPGMTQAWLSLPAFPHLCSPPQPTVGFLARKPGCWQEAELCRPKAKGVVFPDPILRSCRTRPLDRFSFSSICIWTGKSLSPGSMPVLCLLLGWW